MSIEVTYASDVTANETLETNIPAAASPKVLHNQYSTSQSLKASTTPPVTKAAYFEQALTAGAATIDLTALTGTNNLAVDGTGLKVQVFKISIPSTNANTYTIKVGATNGYNLLGANFDVDLEPGMELTIYANDATPDIAAADKTLDCSGTGTESANISIILG